eukprot:1138877-Pelagomonas_calceolata.AAC.2
MFVVLLTCAFSPSAGTTLRENQPLFKLMGPAVIKDDAMHLLTTCVTAESAQDSHDCVTPQHRLPMRFFLTSQNADSKSLGKSLFSLASREQAKKPEAT